MKTILKPTFFAISLGLFSLSAPALSFADHHGGDKAHKMAMQGGDMMKHVHHASFMPNLMKYLLKNKETLKLSEEQAQALNGYRLENSPKVHQMAKQVSELEAQGKQMTLDNFPPQEIIKVGGQSIQIRHDLMIAKLKCRDFVKSVLNEKQYKQALTSFK